jgi:hypothetical protein
LLRREGDKSRAQENFERAIDIFQDCGAEGEMQAIS